MGDERGAFGGQGAGAETDPIAGPALATHAGTDKSTAHPGTIEPGDLSFDPATQTELDAEAAARVAADAGEASARATADSTHAGTDKSTAHPGTIEPGDLSFDPATQAELDTHAGTDKSSAHPGTIEGADIADSTIAAGKLSFDPATQAELDAHTGTDKSTAHPGTIEAADIADGTITTGKLSFDPATQTELDAHDAAGHSFHGALARHASNQAIGSGETRLVLDTEVQDVDNTFFTSSANLTGTVSKTAASNAIVGAGTSFTTELSVGQVISIPGTTTEYGCVSAITDNTHLTLYQNMVNTASGQTAKRENGFVSIPSTGYWRSRAGIQVDASKVYYMTIRVNTGTDSQGTILGINSGSLDAATSKWLEVSTPARLLTKGDFVSLWALASTSGGNAVASNGLPNLSLERA